MFSQSETHSNNTAARTQLRSEHCTRLGARHTHTDATPLVTGSVTSNYCWVYSRRKLEVFSKEDGCLLALYTPSHSSESIRHVTEYRITSQPELPHKHLFLISTSRSTQGPHLLLVFNPDVSRVIKAIQLAFPVFSICPLYSSSKPLSEEREVEGTWPLSEVSCGLVAVGGGSGVVVLVDMRLDDEDEMFEENTPSATTTYRSDEITDRDILRQAREECIADQSHPSYILPGLTLPIRNTFIFRCREEEDNTTYQSSHVIVSCLSHISSLNALAIGYNFGAFQLYDVITLQLMFSSDIDNLPSPVLEVLYQEPEDDPRDFVYLWLVRGHASHLEEDSLPHSILSLYQLLFQSSRSVCTQIGDMRVLEKKYSQFLDGGLKFRHFISSSPYAKQIALSKDTVFISSGIFPQYRRVQEHVWSPESLTTHHLPHPSHTNDLTLAYFIYHTNRSGRDHQAGYHMALFDLNLWYNSQMQTSISPTSRFYHVYDLDSILPLLSSTCDPLLSQDQFSILDLHLTSLQRFDMTPPIPEAFLLPSSLSLRFDSLLPSCLLSCSLLGDQERVLSHTAATLSAGYIDNIESVCVELTRSGIISSTSYTPSSLTTECWEDSVLMLLNASLNHGRLEAIHSCVLNSQSMSGDIPLSLISRWTLSKFEEFRDSLLTQSNLLITDCCNQILISSIKSLLTKFRYLSILLSRIPTAHLSSDLASCGMYPQQRPRLYEKSIEILTLYHEALIWMTSLPPQLLSSYQHSSMLSHYQKLREFHRSPLIIDQMLSQLNPALFDKWTSSTDSQQQQQHEVIYPPPNPLAALEPLLDPSLPEVSQAVLLYFLIDLGMLYEEQTSQPLTNSFINNCPQVPKRLPSLSYSFWLIDNAHYKNGVTELLSVPNSMLQLFPFAIASLLEFLLKSDQSHLVSLLLSVHKPILDTLALFQLYLQALAKAGNIFDALKQLYNFFPIGSTHECLNELLESFDLPALKRLVHTPLDSMVLSQVVEFLQNKDTFIHSEILIMLLLKQNKIVRGVQTYHQIKSAMLSQARSEKEKIRLSLLDQLVQAFAKVSACDLEFAARPPLEHRAPKREISIPTPLSAKIRKHNLDDATNQKQLLSSLNDKVTELQQAKFLFEEVNSSPTQHSSATRHRYKRLSELTYPSPTNVTDTPNRTSAYTHRSTPLKLAMERYLNKSSPVRSSLPPPSLIRLTHAPSSPPPFTTLSHLRAATPSSILKQVKRIDTTDLTPVNLNFSLQETDLSHQRRARFDIPSSSADNEPNDVPYHSPLSFPNTSPLPPPPEPAPEESASPLFTQPYYSPLQHPDQLDSDNQLDSNTPLFQTGDDVNPPADDSQIDKYSIATEHSDRNVTTELDTADTEEARVPDENTESRTEDLSAVTIEHILDTDLEERSVKEASPNILNIPELTKMLPEIEGLEKSNSDLRKHFSPRPDVYPLSKYTPFSVDDEKNKIFASIQLGHSPFNMTTSSLPSHKESFLPLRSVETTTASYILSETHTAPIVSTPAMKTSSLRHKSFQPSSTILTKADTDTDTPLKIPQHNYFTRAKAPSTPKVEVRNSPINFLHTVPVEKQTKPPKVTLFNKSGSLRRSQRLKDRSSN